MVTKEIPITKVTATVIDEIDKVNVLTGRVKKRKEELLAASEHICSKRSRLVTESWKETEGQPIVTRRAKLFQKVMEGNPVVIRDGELIVGSQTEYVLGASPWIDFSSVPVAEILASENIQARGLVTESMLTEEDRRSLAEDLEYWKGRAPGEVVAELLNKAVGMSAEDVADYEESRVFYFSPTLAPPGRAVDYGKVINLGLNGVLRELRQELEKLNLSTFGNYPKYEFLNAGIICCEAVIKFANRYAKLARELAEKEKDLARKDELKKIAEICEWVPANPARTFHEAVQSMWLIHLATNLENASDGEMPGRIDQYLYPLYEKDIAEGRITRQEAAELLGCLWVKLNELLSIRASLSLRELYQASHIQATTICGVDADGNDATNELSFLILEVTGQLAMPQPPLYIRYHKDISEELLIQAAECNRRHGAGSPAFLNDAPTLLLLLKKGIPLREARDWVGGGCIYTQIHHASPPIPGIFHHAAKVFDLTLHNGVDLKTGKQLGLATGDIRNFKSYNELYDAFIKQYEYFTELCVKIYRFLAQITPEVYCLPWTSMLIDDCIKRGEGCMRSGARRPQFGGLADRGWQNIGDSLTAIKKLVFEEKKISMAELLDALETNFEGKEEIRQMLLAAPKYGNDDDYADDIFNTVCQDIGRIAYGHRDLYGYPITIGRGAAAGYFFVGMGVAALPDGRKAWEPIADGSVSAVQGRDVKGPTAVVLSATKINHTEYARSSVLNMKMTPTVLQTREGANKYISFIRSYFNRGGWHAQFNVIDRETLVDAQKHPEQHRNLLVRVGGFSAYFVELGPDVQNEIIARTEHEF